MIRRVLMTADTVGGVWNYSLDLARALGPYGIEVSLATMGKPLSGDQIRQSRSIPNLEVFESGFKLEWMDDPWRDLRQAGRWLLSLEDAVRPDLIHLNGYYHGALPWSVPKLVVCHSCVLSWWKAVKGVEAPVSWKCYASAAARGLAAADMVVAPTRAMLAEARRYYGPFGATQVIPNAADMDRFQPLSKEPFVFAAGRLWDEAKNVVALDAIASNLEWPVLLAGDGTPEGKVGGAKHLGRLSSDDLACWMQKASIYALPAKYEPFGLSVLEAALSGCALVLGDIPSLRENWEGCASFVNPDDRAALQNAIQQLIADPALRKAQSAAALERAREYTTERFAAAYVAAYEQVLGGDWEPVLAEEQAFLA